MMWYLFEGTVCPARCIWLLGIRILIANIFLKISAPLSFIKAFRMNLISAGSISLDSTFKEFHHQFFFISIIEQEREGEAHWRISEVQVLVSWGVDALSQHTLETVFRRKADFLFYACKS